MIATIARPLRVIFAAVVEDVAFDAALLAEVLAEGLLDAPECPIDLAALRAAVEGVPDDDEPCVACGADAERRGLILHTVHAR